jgi:hypothetical protein
MMKAKNRRILELMNDVRWAGVDNWTDVRDELSSVHIPAFRDWFHAHLHYVPERSQKALVDWIDLELSYSPGTKFYVYKDAGITALVALSLYQQDQLK